MTDKTWRRGQKADYTDRPLTAEERVFAEEHHDYLYQFMRWNHLPVEEWYDELVIPYLNAVKKYCSREELHIYPFHVVAEKVLSRAVYGKHRADHAQRRMPEGGFVSLDYELEGDNPFSGHPLDAYWIDKTKNVEAYVIEKEFLRDLFANVSKYAEPELLEMVLAMRILGYTDRDIARRAKLELDDYREWTLAEIKELVRLLTLRRTGNCAMARLVNDTKYFGNIDEYNRRRDLLDM